MDLHGCSYPDTGRLILSVGIAILMMVLFHTLFDPSFFRIFPIDVSCGFWRYFAFATASLFLLIVGISLTISMRVGYPHSILLSIVL